MVCLNRMIATCTLALGMAVATHAACAAPATDHSFADASHGSAPGTTMPPALHAADDGSFADASTHQKSSHEQESTLHHSALVVPEPGTPLLMLAGAVTLAIRMRRSGRSNAI